MADSSPSLKNPLRNDFDGHQGVHLKKSINLWHGVGIIVGIMIGSGIFISPKGVAQFSGSVGMSLLVWLGAGLLSAVGAHSYTELGCMLPASGGDYEYILKAFGSLFGFLYVWAMLILVIPASNAIAALTFANYLLEPLFPCQVPSSAVIILSTLAVLALMALNVLSVKASTRVQTGFSTGKFAALVFIVALGIFAAAKGHVSNYKNLFANTSYQAKDLIQAFYNGLYCYSGWNYLNFMAEEIEKPTRNLPRAIWIAMIAVIAIFMAVNLAYFTLLSPVDMQSTNAVAVSFAELIYWPFSYLISFFVALSTFGFLNGVMMTTSRVIFAAARNKHMPSAMALIQVKFLTPIVSLVIITILTIICITVTDVFFLINITAFTEYLTIFVSIIGLLVLRKTHPEWKRPIKVNTAFPVIFSVVCLFILIVSVVTLPYECGLAAIMLVIGIVIYVALVNQRYDSMERLGSRITEYVQLATNSVFED
ncbi:hypothetical protein GJ496_007621 [Pomphorhynchus laevis]|nr:hypothetical protein GJ496_007621 [Pomphorhynchus laevis]